MRSFYKEDSIYGHAIKFAETQPSGYLPITDEDILKELYAEKYKKYTEDGVEFYNDFRVQLAMAIGNGITAEQAFETELHLADLKDSLITGNWLTAKYICENKSEYSLFDSTLKSEILTGINNYINENY